MRAEHYGWCFPVTARQGHVEIRRRVAGDLQSHPLAGVGHRGVCALLAGTVGVAGDAGLIEAILA